MEEKLKTKIREIYNTGHDQGMHEVDGFDTFAPHWYEELQQLFREEVEKAMPESLTNQSSSNITILSYNDALVKYRDNLLKAIGGE